MKKLSTTIICLILLFAGIAAAVTIWSDYADQTAGNVAGVDTFLMRDVSDTTLAATGTQKEYPWSVLLSDLDTAGYVKTLLFEGATETPLTVDSATPTVVSRGLYNCTGSTTLTITDFAGTFSDGDYIGVYMNDADVTIDFSTGTHITGNAETDFTGMAAEANTILIIFVSRGGVWKAINLNSGFSNALTFAAKVVRNVTTVTGNLTGAASTAAMLWNGTFIVTAAAVIDAKDVILGMEVWVIAETDSDVDFNPGDSDVITLNGTADTAGDAVRLTNKGEVLHCTGTGVNA